MASTYDNMSKRELEERRKALQKHIDYIDQKMGGLSIQSKKADSVGFLTNVFHSVTSAISTPAPAPKTVIVKKVAPSEDTKAAEASAKAATKAAEAAAKAQAKEREKAAKAAAKEAEKAAKEREKEAEKRTLTEEREANRAREQAAREAAKRAAATATPAKKGVVVEYDDGLARTSARKIKATKPVIIAVLRKNGVECSEKDNVPRLSALAEHHNLIRKCEDEQAKIDK